MMWVALYFLVGFIVVAIDFNRSILNKPLYVMRNRVVGSIVTVLLWPWCLFVRLLGSR